jgi:phenylalanyl-tRNA synthetase beta chain
MGEEHDGILRLTELGLDPELGTDAISLLGLDDYSVEVNVTPDRGYALSMRGIAREYSNSTGATLPRPAALRPRWLSSLKPLHPASPSQSTTMPRSAARSAARSS